MNSSMQAMHVDVGVLNTEGEKRSRPNDLRGSGVVLSSLEKKQASEAEDGVVDSERKRRVTSKTTDVGLQDQPCKHGTARGLGMIRQFVTF